MSKLAKKEREKKKIQRLLIFCLAFHIRFFCLSFNFMCILKFSANRLLCCFFFNIYFVCVINWRFTHSTHTTHREEKAHNIEKCFSLYLLDGFFVGRLAKSQSFASHSVWFEIDWKYLPGLKDKGEREKEWHRVNQVPDPLNHNFSYTRSLSRENGSSV